MSNKTIQVKASEFRSWIYSEIDLCLSYLEMHSKACRQFAEQPFWFRLRHYKAGSTMFKAFKMFEQMYTSYTHTYFLVSAHNVDDSEMLNVSEILASISNNFQKSLVKQTYTNIYG